MAPGELVGEARLAQPRLAGDENAAQLAGPGPVEFGFELDQLRLASDEAGYPSARASARSHGEGPSRRRWPGWPRLVPFDDDGRQGLGQAFEHQVPGGGESEVAPGADQDPDEVAGQDLPGVGAVAEPFGDHHGRAEVVAAVGDGLAGVEPDPHLDRHR